MPKPRFHSKKEKDVKKRASKSFSDHKKIGEKILTLKRNQWGYKLLGRFLRDISRFFVEEEKESPDCNFLASLWFRFL